MCSFSRRYPARLIHLSIEPPFSLAFALLFPSYLFCCLLHSFFCPYSEAKTITQANNSYISIYCRNSSVCLSIQLHMINRNAKPFDFAWLNGNSAVKPCQAKTAQKVSLAIRLDICVIEHGRKGVCFGCFVCGHI